MPWYIIFFVPWPVKTSWNYFHIGTMDLTVIEAYVPGPWSLNLGSESIVSYSLWGKSCVAAEPLTGLSGLVSHLCHHKALSWPYPVTLTDALAGSRPDVVCKAVVSIPPACVQRQKKKIRNCISNPANRNLCSFNDSTIIKELFVMLTSAGVTEALS